MNAFSSGCLAFVSVILSRRLRHVPVGLSMLTSGFACGAMQAAAQPPTLPTRVNDPSMDTTGRNGQSNSSIVDLGFGNLVAAFDDEGSTDTSYGARTGYAYSSDGGGTWTDAGKLPGDYQEYDPKLAFSVRRKSVYLLAQGGPFLYKSTDNGHTFAMPIRVMGGGGAGSLAVDNFEGAGNGNVYVCADGYRDASQQREQFEVLRSSDGGSTFEYAVLAPGRAADDHVGKCTIAVGPDHRVSVFFLREISYNRFTIYSRTSTDGGQTFTGESLVTKLNATFQSFDFNSESIGRTAYPVVAINPVGSRPYIYVAYHDVDPDNSSLKAEIYYVKSVDGGSTWSVPAKVNDDVTRDQYSPGLAFAKGGEQIMFGYYSYADDAIYPRQHRQSRPGVLTSSGDVSLQPSFRLSPDTLDIFRGIEPSVDMIFGGAGAFSSTWTDNRAGQSDIFFARIDSPPATADLELSIEAAPTSTTRGQDIVFSITAKSTGGPSKNVFVDVPRSQDFVVKSVEADRGQCSLIYNAVGCSLGIIGANATRTIRVTAIARHAGNLALNAQATTSSLDRNLANNNASGALTISGANAFAATYSTGRIAVPINDLTTVDVPINVSDVGHVISVSAAVRLIHPEDRQLTLSLVSPDNQVILLSDRRGPYYFTSHAGDYGSGASDCSATFTTFNDDAKKPISSGTPPFRNGFAPDRPLFFLTGTPTQGSWKLRVSDAVTEFQGTVRCFQLTIVRSP